MSNFSEILSDVRNGNPILIVDDHDRENEGDIVIAAEKATIDNIAFCMRYARGLMCMPCSGEILDSLELPMMVENSTDRNQTPFTVSVDAAEDTSTGMSAADRLATISVFLNPERKPSDLNRPGHLFPLRPQDDLLKERKGHTEASIEVVKAAGFQQTCIIVEIINDDGTMAKGNDLIKFCKKHSIAMISVQEIYDSIYKQSV